MNKSKKKKTPKFNKPMMNPAKTPTTMPKKKRGKKNPLMKMLGM